jgi:hypothetical protein
MLTDLQIEELATRMGVPLEGVYFKNEIPKPLKCNKTYIINLQDSITDDGDENGGTHWTMFQINKIKDKYIPFYFDSFGAPPPEVVKTAIKNQFKVYTPYTKKDIQSLMNNACGYYCLALSHYINKYKGRTGIFYDDIDDFLDMFDDLNTSIDWKKNEYILKQFFLDEEKEGRINNNVYDKTIEDYERIIEQDKNRIDIDKIPDEYKVKK